MLWAVTIITIMFVNALALSCFILTSSRVTLMTMVIHISIIHKMGMLTTITLTTIMLTVTVPTNTTVTLIMPIHMVTHPPSQMNIRSLLR
jgi:hypothetical protein